MQEEKGIIQSNEKIAKDTYRMKIAAGMAKDMKPGQFVNIKIDGYMPVSYTHLLKKGALYCFLFQILL